MQAMHQDAARTAVEGWIATTNAHDAEAYGAIITDDYTWTLWSATTTGRDVSKEAWLELWKAFPDLKIELLDTIVDGHRVAARFRMSGTHQGPLRFRGTRSWDHPFGPSGRKFALEGMGWWETRDGRVSISRAYWQPTELLRQLGLG